MSKFVRTVILSASGSIKAARINLQTGEIKPFQYRHKTEPRACGSLDREQTRLCHWQIIPAPGAYRKPVPAPLVKSKPNPNNVFLTEYQTATEASEEITFFDDLLTGVSHLHDGKKPLNQSLLFRLFRDLDDINAPAIQAYTGCNERHARKLAASLRVLANAFDMAIENS